MRIGSLAGPLELGKDYWRWVQAARSDQARPEFWDQQSPPNVGDWFVTKIVDRLLDFDEIVLLTPASTERDWDRMNEECDAVVLKGGNYLFPGWFEANLPPELLERVRVPIVMFGAGIENVPAGGVPFTPNDLRALHLIHDSAASSSVRGEISAQVLADHGITNTIVTGCPTLFWSRGAELRLRPASLDRVGFTFRNYLFSDEVERHRAQFRALQEVRDAADDTVVILQGEEVSLQLLHLVRTAGAEHAGWIEGWGDRSHVIRRTRLDEEQLMAEAHAFYDEVAGSELVDWLVPRTYHSWDPDDYLSLYRRSSLLVGCRLHSNLLATATGTPAYFLTYDDRTREIASLLDAPSSDVADFDASRLLEHDWSSVEKRYRELHARLVEFLDANRLAHLLGASR